VDSNVCSADGTQQWQWRQRHRRKPHEYAAGGDGAVHAFAAQGESEHIHKLLETQQDERAKLTTHNPHQQRASIAHESPQGEHRNFRTDSMKKAERDEFFLVGSGAFGLR